MHYLHRKFRRHQYLDLVSDGKDLISLEPNSEKSSKITRRNFLEVFACLTESRLINVKTSEEKCDSAVLLSHVHKTVFLTKIFRSSSRICQTKNGMPMNIPIHMYVPATKLYHLREHCTAMRSLASKYIYQHQNSASYNIKAITLFYTCSCDVLTLSCVKLHLMPCTFHLHEMNASRQNGCLP